MVLRKFQVKAFTVLESLIVLSVVAFMTLVFSTSFNRLPAKLKS